MELDAIMNESESIKDWIIDIRRELHRFPELMYEEHRTNALVREKLDELGIEYEFPIAETGVLASIGNGDCLLYTSPSPRDLSTSRMPSSA